MLGRKSVGQSVQQANGHASLKHGNRRASVDAGGLGMRLVECGRGIELTLLYIRAHTGDTVSDKAWGRWV